MNTQKRTLLIDLVVELQNYPENSTQDNLTICGMFRTEKDFIYHIMKLAKKVNKTSLYINKCYDVAYPANIA